MDGFSINLLGLRVFILCIGLMGNVFLILAIIQTKFSRVKSFDLFLLGLAAANLEEILIVTVFDVITLRTSSDGVDAWSCRSLKFLTKFGEIASILFTVLISVFRQQKLRDANQRASLPIYLDSIRSAWMASGVCVLLAALLSLPVFIIVPEGPTGNFSRNGSSCPLDFFQCSERYCPTLNAVYKYLFLLVCNLLPLAVVTVTGCLIIAVLLGQRTKVTPASGGRRSRGSNLHRSTVAVLAAMGLFQLDWTLYLIFQLTVSPTDFSFWAEAEFLISFSYTSISPYVYGIGNNLFSLKNFKKK
ncbi:gonadotropin-releasing hormone receptor [Cebidichthys violaceus]|uniref:gonadotropin-releasing hormone receptor n=1 Tax=Cebidichthys violaceus TaxID=271503 RepID=UPI0035CA1D2E